MRICNCFQVRKQVGFVQTSDLSERVRQHIEPVIEGLGYSLVELKANRNRTNLHVSVVIYSPAGVSLNDCADVHRTIQPRIELLEDTRDLHIEVASPGVDRNIKSSSEYAVFTGRGVRVMLRDTKDWKGGVIESADDSTLRLRTGETIEDIPYDRILKAKLDYSQEVG
jgi:ribosome maturation factor RimP